MVDTHLGSRRVTSGQVVDLNTYNGAPLRIIAIQLGEPYIYIRCIHTQGEREGENSYLCLRSAFERTGEPVSI